MWKGIRNKGRWLKQAYEENAETVLELCLKTDLKSAHRVYKKEQTLVQV